MKAKLFIAINLLATVLTSYASITVYDVCPIGPLSIAIQGIGLSCVYATWPVSISNEPPNQITIETIQDYNPSSCSYTITGIGQVYTVKDKAVVIIAQPAQGNFCICDSGCNESSKKK